MSLNSPAFAKQWPRIGNREPNILGLILANIVAADKFPDVFESKSTWTLGELEQLTGYLFESVYSDASWTSLVAAYISPLNSCYLNAAGSYCKVAATPTMQLDHIVKWQPLLQRVWKRPVLRCCRPPSLQPPTQTQAHWMPTITTNKSIFAQRWKQLRKPRYFATR
jgi:hypothetical protein